MNAQDTSHSDYPDIHDSYAAPARYARDSETLTPEAIVESYTRACQMLYGTAPNCTPVGGVWYLVDDTMRDRRWLLLEVERLRQEALVAAVDEGRANPKASVIRLIRRLANL